LIRQAHDSTVTTLGQSPSTRQQSFQLYGQQCAAESPLPLQYSRCIHRGTSRHQNPGVGCILYPVGAQTIYPGEGHLRVLHGPPLIHQSATAMNAGEYQWEMPCRGRRNSRTNIDEAQASSDRKVRPKGRLPIDRRMILATGAVTASMLKHQFTARPVAEVDPVPSLRLSCTRCVPV